jgi:hypothetical protein
MKYSKTYRKAIICLAIALATVVWLAAAGAALAWSPSNMSFLGMDRWVTTMTLFFVPSITGAALMLGINFWFTAEGKRFGWYGLSETAQQK